jgi:hypothetical protein
MNRNKTINALSLEQHQQRVVDLRKVPAGHKQQQAAREIETITRSPGWNEPVKIAVKKVWGAPYKLEGLEFNERGIAMTYLWQYRALSRFLELVEPLPEEESAEAEKSTAAAAAVRPPCGRSESKSCPA